jgi:hypothetical protein
MRTLWERIPANRRNAQRVLKGAFMGRFSFAGIAAVTLVCLFAFGTALAQQPGPGGVPVQILVTVEPRHGSNIPVINREDVKVMEGRARDTVTDWIPAQGDRGALELFILIDDQSSTTVGSQFEDLRQFINAQPSAAKVGVAYMQNGIARVTQDLTTDHAQAAKSLRLPLGAGGADSSPYFALSDLAKKWPRNNARHEVLMITDGIDRYYGTGDLQDPYLQSSIDDAVKAGIVVSAIYSPGVGHFGHSYWQTYWGQIYLAQLAEKTGGEAYYIGMTGPPVSFSPYLDDLGHRLEHQYWLTFLTKPVKKSGWQQVRITTETRDVDLVSAGRVWVSSE